MPRDRFRPKKAGFFSLIRIPIATSKNAKTVGCLDLELGWFGALLPLVVRFQHSHPVSIGTFANFGIKGPLAKTGF
jgi:hypothetical protein